MFITKWRFSDGWCTYREISDLRNELPKMAIELKDQFGMDVELVNVWRDEA